MLFRPEQKHGLSGEHNVVVPMARRHSDVNHTLSARNSSLLHIQDHLVIAASAGSRDASIFVKHGGNAKRVPNAVCPPLALADLNRKSRRHGGKRRSPPQLSTLLKNKGVALGKPFQTVLHLAQGAGERSRHFRHSGRLLLADEICVDELPQLIVESRSGLVGFIGACHRLSASAHPPWSAESAGWALCRCRHTPQLSCDRQGLPTR